MNKSNLSLAVVCVFFLIAGCSDQPDSQITGNQPESKSPSIVANDVKTSKAADAATPKTTDETGSFFVVDHYDPKRDAAQDLAMTTELASKSGKRILIEVGGKW